MAATIGAFAVQAIEGTRLQSAYYLNRQFLIIRFTGSIRIVLAWAGKIFLF